MIEASAPCRIDMGGTSDIRTFYYPLRHLKPCTFNIAIDLRTRVRVSDYHKEMVKVSSKGFDSAEFPADTAPFDHPLGLIFAIAAYFRASGVHIEIESESPPRSALGGSSVAAVALIAAFSKMFKLDISQKNIAILAHAIEESVAGVPCGMQDQLAAVYGGVNAWYWSADPNVPLFERKKLNVNTLENRLLLAYCGIPHVSADINGRWVKGFLSGRYRTHWAEIIQCTHQFIEAIQAENINAAADAVNREVSIRREMTPDVLDEMGEKLAEAAIRENCAARFTGAGAGGCLWAIGENIDRLKPVWEKILSERAEACLLPSRIDTEGLKLFG
jgi:D-glycero-alpha-D-manno-heptose-7-phosphate kinase